MAGMVGVASRLVQITNSSLSALLGSLRKSFQCFLFCSPDCPKGAERGLVLRG